MENDANEVNIEKSVEDTKEIVPDSVCSETSDEKTVIQDSSEPEASNEITASIDEKTNIQEEQNPQAMEKASEQPAVSTVNDTVIDSVISQIQTDDIIPEPIIGGSELHEGEHVGKAKETPIQEQNMANKTVADDVSTEKVEKTTVETEDEKKSGDTNEPIAKYNAEEPETVADVENRDMQAVDSEAKGKKTVAFETISIENPQAKQDEAIETEVAEDTVAVVEQEERDEQNVEETAVQPIEEQIDPKTTLQNQEIEKETFQNLVDENVRLKTDNDKVKSELDKIHGTYSELETSVKELTHTNKEQSVRITKLQVELEKAKSAPNQTNEEKIKDLQQKLLTLANQDREKERQLSQVQKEFRETNLKLQNAEKNNGALPQSSQSQKSGACTIL